MYEGVCISGFLGHRVFHVLGKLVFCIYMYQEIIQLQTIGAIETPTYQSLTLIVSTIKFPSSKISEKVWKCFVFFFVFCIFINIFNMQNKNK